jgi:hypothetical protein
MFTDDDPYELKQSSVLKILNLILGLVLFVLGGTGFIIVKSRIIVAWH